MKTLLSLALLITLASCTKSAQLNVSPAVPEHAAASVLARAVSTSPTYQLLSFAAARVRTGSKITWTAVGETNISGYDVQTSGDRLFATFNTPATYPSSNSNSSITRSYLHNYSSAYFSHDYMMYYRLKTYHLNNTISYGPVDSVKVLVNEKKFYW